MNKVHKRLVPCKIQIVMNKLFYDLDNPTAFTSAGPLQKASKKSAKAVANFLEKQNVYSRHKQIRYKFPRRRTYGIYVFSHVQTDLIDISSYSRSNKGFRFALTMIDLFSRFSFCIPIKRKTGENVAEALRTTFDKVGMYPAFLIADKGREYSNSIVKDYLKSRFINLIHPESDIKCSVVERFNRTWETRLYKYFTYSGTVKWLDAGKKIVDGINKSYHRIIKCTPEEVFTGKKQPADAVARMEEEQKQKVPRYKVGTRVRMSRPDSVFRRGYKSNWTDEVFQILYAYPGNPPVYRLVDEEGEDIMGIVYEQEMVKAA